MTLDPVVRAVTRERDLLEQLRSLLLEQRAAVADNDTKALETNLEATGRVVQALSGAKRDREAAVAAVAGRGDVALGALEERLGAPLPPALHEARQAVRRAAEALARDLAINRHVLQRAVEAGSAFLERWLSAVAAAATPVGGYASARPTVFAGGTLLNRKA